jgi:hypothetical protein
MSQHAAFDAIAQDLGTMEPRMFTNTPAIMLNEDGIVVETPATPEIQPNYNNESSIDNTSTPEKGEHKTDRKETPANLPEHAQNRMYSPFRFASTSARLTTNRPNTN